MMLFHNVMDAVTGSTESWDVVSYIGREVFVRVKFQDIRYHKSTKLRSGSLYPCSGVNFESC